MDQAVYILGLDIGSVRIGVAKSLWPDGIPTKVSVLPNDDRFKDNLKELIDELNAKFIVAGLPRSLNGNETEQTRLITKFVDDLKQTINVPIYLQDEAATSIKAEEELKANNKDYSKADIDALSAVYILEDFISAHPKGENLE